MRQERTVKPEGELEEDQLSTLELIAAFIDGTIDDAGKVELLSLLADDEDTYEVFVGALECVRLEADAAARERRARSRGRLIGVVTLLIIVFALFFYVWW